MADSKKTERAESEGILARIDAQIAALQAVRESVVKAMALGIGLGGDVDGAPAPFSIGGAPAGRTPIELPIGAFRNKSIPDAIKLFLAAARQKRTIRQIAEGLREGGLETTSRRFETTVTGALYRLKDAGLVLKFKDGLWDLSESYPEHIRKSISTESRPTKKTTRKRAAKGKTKNGEPKAAKIVSRAALGMSTVDQIIGILGEGPTSTAVLSERIGLPLNVVALAVGRLIKAEQIEKLSNGLFALRQATPLRAVV